MLDIIGFWSSVSIMCVLSLFLVLNLIFCIISIWISIITENESDEFLDRYYISFYKRLGMVAMIEQSNTDRWGDQVLNGEYKEGLNSLFYTLVIASSVFTVVLAIAYLGKDMLPIEVISSWSLFVAPVLSWIVVVPLCMFLSTKALRKLYKIGKTMNNLINTKEDK